MCWEWGWGGHAILLLLTTSLNELSPIKTNGQRIKGRTDRRMERHIWKTASHCPSWGQCHQLYCTLDKSSSIFLLLVRKNGSFMVCFPFLLVISLSSKKTELCYDSFLLFYFGRLLLYFEIQDRNSNFRFLSITWRVARCNKSEDWDSS